MQRVKNHDMRAICVARRVQKQEIILGLNTWGKVVSAPLPEGENAPPLGGKESYFYWSEEGAAFRV